MSNRRVVITGIGVVAPNGVGKSSFLQALREGRSGIRFDPALAEQNFQCRISGIPDLSQVDKSFYFSPMQQRQLFSTAVTYAMIASKDAWLDAGLQIPGKDQVDWDSGAVIGAGSVATDNEMPVQVKKIYTDKNVRRLGSGVTEQRMNNGPAVFISGALGLGNWVTSNSSACSTGTEAVIMGYNWIQQGKARRMVCGSTEGEGPLIWAGFESMRIMVRDSNDEPEKGARPLSDSANGFVPATGAATLILEEYETAKKRGAPIYAEILAGFSNSGGQQMGGSMVAPNSTGVQRCIDTTIRQSGINAGDIDLISGHLTGTMADPLEIENWQAVIGRKGEDFPYINSLKSMTGHSFGAAGSIELAACCLQMKHNFIHPTLNAYPLHPEIKKRVAASRIPSERSLDYELNIIAKTSFAFGDTNSCVILRKI